MWCVTGPLTMVLAAPNTELVPLQDRTQLLDSLLLEDSADAAESKHQGKLRARPCAVWLA